MGSMKHPVASKPMAATDLTIQTVLQPACHPQVA
jgi:hypothetical protein